MPQTAAGPAGTGLVILVFVILGDSASGGPFARPLLPGLWRTIGGLFARFVPHSRPCCAHRVNRFVKCGALRLRGWVYSRVAARGRRARGAPIGGARLTRREIAAPAPLGARRPIVTQAVPAPQPGLTAPTPR